MRNEIDSALKSEYALQAKSTRKSNLCLKLLYAKELQKVN